MTVRGNGIITFDADNRYTWANEAEHRLRRQVAALWDGMDLEAGGDVRYAQLDDRVVITWWRVPGISESGDNTAQAELFFDGRIRMSYAWVSTRDGLVGISPGGFQYSSVAEADLVSSAAGVPEIVVEQPASVASMENGVSTVGFTAVLSQSLSRTFTIRNAGDVSLTGISASIAGPDAGQFTVSVPTTTLLAPRDSSTFVVTFTPSGPRARQATLQVSSNDGDENPFTVALTGIDESNLAPVSVPGGPYSMIIGNNLTLDGSASYDPNASDSITNYAWDLDNDGEFDDASGPSPEIPWSALESLPRPGPNPVHLRVSDRLGVEGAATTQLIIRELPVPTYEYFYTTAQDLFDLSWRSVTFLPRLTGGYTLAPTATITELPHNSATDGLLNAISSHDDAYTAIDLTDGKVFPFFNTDYSRVYVSSNGLITFDSGSASYHEYPTEHFNRRQIALLWRDLNTGAAGDVRSAQLADRLVITFENVRQNGSASLQLTGQAELFFDGTIRLSYGATTISGGLVGISPGSYSGSQPETDFSVISTEDPEIALRLPDGSTPANGEGILSFGIVSVGDTPTQTVTIRNEGGSTLAGLTTVVTDGGAAGFSIAQQLISSDLAHGAQTSFVVRFSPAVAGEASAVLEISSNDPDEHPFQILLSGTGAGVDIAVEHPAGTLLNDGGAYQSFANQLAGTTSPPKTFTVRNSGTEALTGIAVSIDGPGAEAFGIDATAVPASLNPGESANFTVTFTPTLRGEYRADIYIASNDPNENPFDIGVSGQGLAPELVIGFGADGGGGGGGGGGVSSHDFGNVQVLASKSIPLTIANPPPGDGILTILSVSIVGNNPEDFSWSAPWTTTTLFPGDQTSINVTFTPTATGPRDARLRVVTDSVVDGTREFLIEGDGVRPIPFVREPNPVPGGGNGTFGSSGLRSWDFGEKVVGDPGPVVTFPLSNDGTADLVVSGIAVDGEHAADFLLEATNTVGTFPPGSITSFTLRFTAGALGVRNATLRITSNDLEEPVKTIDLSGTGVPPPAPEIGVTGNYDFGNAIVGGSSVTRDFTISNTGNAELNLTGTPMVEVSGGHAADFTVTALPSSPIAPGGNSTFTIRFAPTASGLRSATLSIASNDADENPYTLNIQGRGDVPDIAVTGNSVGIANGDTTPAEADHTDFGAFRFGSGTVTRTFTIVNNGSSALDLTGSPLVALSGENADDFSVTSAPSTPLAPNESTTFAVTFSPSASGMRAAMVNIASNDSLKSPYTFSIQGATTAPLISVSGNGTSIVSGDSSPSEIDHTNFGATALDGDPVLRNFTISNGGSANLLLTGSSRVAISGTHAADFSVTVLPATPVTPGQMTTFQITFAPVAEGLRTALVTIASDDTERGPYAFAIHGQSNAPDIGVSGNGVMIAAGDMGPTEADHTDFGSVRLDSGAIVRTFTIHNDGAAPLALNGSPLVELDGDQSGAFSVTTLPVSPVAPGASTTFQVAFEPSVVGSQQAQLSISNNDPDESPYVFAIRATVTAPVIVVSGNDNSIASGALIPSLTDHTDFGATDVGGASVVRTFTISNNGTAPLILNGSPLVAVSGPHAGEFNVTALPSGPVAAANSTTFQITFTPAADGIRTALVSIESDDSDRNPFTFAIQGRGMVPDISVTGNGVDIPSGSTSPETANDTDFGTLRLGDAAITRTFTISNTGSPSLQLNGTPLVMVGGANAGEFVVTAMPASSIAPGGTTTFTVSFVPADRGLRSAMLSIASNDPDENPFTFSIQGRGDVLDIAVSGNGVGIVNGDSTPNVEDHSDFGALRLGMEFITRTFTILNNGTSNLDLSGSPRVAVSGSNAADFTVLTMPSTPLAPGATTSFQVRFSPAAIGLRTATLGIASNDTSKNPFTFAIQGTATAPVISVSGNGSVIASGDSSPSVEDHTDFGSTALGGTAILRTFSISNDGTAALLLNGSPRVAISGSHAADFSVTTLPSTPVAAGQFTTFQLSFAPGGKGMRTALVTIASDDAGRNPYTFAIQGRGDAPDMFVSGNGLTIAAGDMVPSEADRTDYGSLRLGSGTIVNTFTISNEGEAPLVLNGTPLVAVTGANAGDFAVTTAPSSTLAPGGTTTFQIGFSPSASGLRSATLSIANNDPDGSPYVFAIQGTATVPVITVSGNGSPIAAGDMSPSEADHTNFGSANVGGVTVVRNFVLGNAGTAPLILSGSPIVSVAGTHAADFAVTTLPSTPVAAGESTSFVVTFTPSATGPRTALVTIASDDPQRNPFTFAIQGTGTAAVISVSGNGNVISAGDSSPSLTDHTDFGTVAVGGGPVARTFSIANVGTGGLLLTGTPLISISGNDAADFTVTTFPATPVVAGTTTEFQVVFAPGAEGLRTALVSIASDDGERNPYTFSIQGEGNHFLLRTLKPTLLGVQSGAQLGYSVAVDGELTVVGARYDDFGGTNAGVVKVFNSNTGALLHVIPNPTPASNDWFGHSVAISGTRVVVGAYGDDTGAYDAGSAYVYDLTAATPTVPVVTLNNPDPASSDYFGYSVAISGTRVVVGAYYDDTGAYDAGSAYVYDLTAATPHVPVTTLNNPTPASSYWFGHSVAISGTRVVVGAPHDDTGATNAGSAYVYDLTTATPHVPVTTLNNPGPAGSDYFGYSVAISGTRVVVGAPYDDIGAYDAGSAYVYDLAAATPTVPVTTLSNPTPASHDNFGWSVSISGTRVVVGACRDDTGAYDAGSAYVYDLTAATPTVPVTTLNNPTPASYDNFGWSVAITGTRVVVGAPYDDTGSTDAGSAYVYNLTAATPAVPVTTLNNPGPASGDLFGISVAISGRLMVVGAFHDGTGRYRSGRAYVYDLASPAPDIPVFTLDNPTPADYDYFGRSVAISGTRVVVGAYGDDTGATDAGSAYVYDLTAATPTVPVATLNNPTPASSDWFGHSVAISGTRVVVGTPYDDTGAYNAGSAYVYDMTAATPHVPVTTLNNPTPASSYWFGHSVAISGTRVVVGTPHDNTGAYNAGSAYVYDMTAATPHVPVTTLNNPTPADYDYFGHSVAISGTRVVVGAYYDDTGAYDAGSAYVYDLTAATPAVPVTTLNNPTPASSDWFGHSVAISGTRVVVGAYRDDTGATNAGSAYVYDLTAATPTVPVTTLNNPTPASSDWFGHSVAISGTRVVVGAYGDDSVLADRGAAHVFDTGPEIRVEEPVGANVSDAVAFDPIIIGQSGAAKTFTIRNSGYSTLTGVTAVLDGTHSGDFILDASTTAASLPPGATTTFTVRFIPTAAGLRSASVSITSNDLDQQILAIALSGTGLEPTDPEIRITGNNLEIANGDSVPDGSDHTEFGQTGVGGIPVFRAFSISNQGALPLQLTGSPIVAVSGANAGDFTVVTAPAGPLGYGHAASFEVRFVPTGVGLRTASLSISSNDADRTPYTFSVQGTGFSYAVDSDGDGLSDAAEVDLSEFGFDPAVIQTELVQALDDNAAAAGLKTIAEIQQQNPSATLLVKGTDGVYTLTMAWESSAGLTGGFSQPFGAPIVSILADGSIQLEYTNVAAPSQFYRFSLPQEETSTAPPTLGP